MFSKEIKMFQIYLCVLLPNSPCLRGVKVKQKMTLGFTLDLEDLQEQTAEYMFEKIKLLLSIFK